VTPSDPQAAVSVILDEVKQRREGAEERLFEVVYDELRRMAHGQMSREEARGTLQTTALVHEAYMRLVKDDQAEWENRRHFFGAAARAMRQILVDRARKRRALRHGGDKKHVPLESDVADAERSVDLIALDEALDRLAAERPRHAQVVLYRYFLGLTVKETADLLDVAPRTVDTDWAVAKAWLKREITGKE
jgi:RNA polymerase sigma factor (TIGR02999 family)